MHGPDEQITAGSARSARAHLGHVFQISRIAITVSASPIAQDGRGGNLVTKFPASVDVQMR
jgi:hypothetical protein